MIKNNLINMRKSVLINKKNCEKITNMTEEVESIYFFFFEKISKVFVEKSERFILKNLYFS